MANWWRSAKILASLPLSPIGRSRIKLNTLVKATQSSRNSTGPFWCRPEPDQQSPSESPMPRLAGTNDSAADG
jgi:hypothetical protein